MARGGKPGFRLKNMTFADHSVPASSSIAMPARDVSIGAKRLCVDRLGKTCCGFAARVRANSTAADMSLGDAGDSSGSASAVPTILLVGAYTPSARSGSRARAGCP